MFDTHLHIYEDDDFDKIVSDAHAVGVDKLLLAGTNLEDSTRYCGLSKAHDGVFCGVGVHPHDAEKFEGIEPFEKLARENNENVIAVSEVGLDYFYELSNREAQKPVFIEFIKLANRLKLPLVIHCREAEADCYEILKAHPPEHYFVLHCFTGTKEWAEKFVELGAYFSVGGVLTFKKSDNVREMFTAIPNHRFCLETDSPYLSPVPFRGKRNQPAHVVAVAKYIAGLREMSEEELIAMTSKVASKLFLEKRDA